MSWRDPTKPYVPLFANPRQAMADLRESHEWVTRELETAVGIRSFVLKSGADALGENQRGVESAVLMPIGRCSHCGLNYWRYSPSTVPGRYCSIPCFDARRKKPAPKDIDPHLMVAEIREHLARWHPGEDWLLDECAACETLQRRYASALYEAV